MEKFYEKISEIFKDLGVSTPEFRYNPKTLEYYSLYAIPINNEEYSIVVPEDGSVQYGIIENDKFYPEGTLGYIFLT